MWTPFDIVGIYYWYATAYRLYMHEEQYNSAPVTQVDLGDLVGQVAGQVLGLKTGTSVTGDRPTYTSNISANAYMIFGPSGIRHSIQSSENQFPFFFEEATRKWTIAFKIRFHNANASDFEVIIDSNNNNSIFVGINVRRNVGDDFIRCTVSNGIGINILLINSEAITDTDWHDVVIKSDGGGANQVSIQIDLGDLVISEYTNFLSQNMTNELTFGATATGSSTCPCDIADLIILDSVIGALDLTKWRDFIQFPTMDPIVATVVKKFKGDISSGQGFNASVFSPDSLTWNTTPIPVERSVGGTPAGETTEDDTVFDTFTSATIYNETQIEVDLGPEPPPTLPGSGGSIALEFESKDTNVQTVDTVGRTTWVKNDMSRIVTKYLRGNKSDDVATSEDLGANSKVFNRFTVGSASKDCFDSTSVPMDGNTANDASQKVFSTFVVANPPTLIRTSEPTFWGINLDLRAIVAQVDADNWWNPGILITPSCFVNASHASTPLNKDIWWVDNSGNLYSRQAIDKVRLLYGDANNTYVTPGFLDFALSFLDSPLPVDIPPAKFLPLDFQNQFPSVVHRLTPTPAPPYFGNGIPSFLVNKDKKLSYSETWSTYVTDFKPPEVDVLLRIGSAPSDRDPQKDFNIPLITGDSGTALCVSINGETVVLWTYSQWVTSFQDIIQAVIDDFALGETVSTVDLSGFPTFP